MKFAEIRDKLIEADNAILRDWAIRRDSVPRIGPITEAEVIGLNNERLSLLSGAVLAMLNKLSTLDEIEPTILKSSDIPSLGSLIGSSGSDELMQKITEELEEDLNDC